jgi:hypothetical protein
MSTLETVKTKAPAKKKAAPKAKAKAVAAPAPVPAPTREEIARLAEKFWMERGRADGSAEQDWLRAERELLGIAS